MLTSFDQWIGAKIMQPTIIRFCQFTGLSQFAVARYGWMIAAWTLVMRISFEGWGNWIYSLLAILLSLRETYLAAMHAEQPAAANDLMRRLILLFTAFDVCTLVMATYMRGSPGLNWSHAWDFFALVAEYAKTIRTIPPRRTEQSTPRVRAADARG